MIGQIFSILNFLVIIGVMVYIFRRYIQGEIEQKIRYENGLLRQLRLTHDALVSEQKQVQESVLDQDRICKQLRSNADHWKQIIEKESNEKDAQQEQIYRTLEQKIQQQNHYYSLKMDMKAVLSDVQKNLEQEAMSVLADEQKGRAYIAHVLAKLR